MIELTPNSKSKRPAIFFDVDGVLNLEPGTQGVLGSDDVRLIPGTGDAVRRAREAGMATVAVTNRSQIARGLVSFDDLDRILDRLEALLADSGGVLDRIYFCPHHPDGDLPGGIPELKIACECRKPGSLMLRQAMADFPIDAARSAAIGDSLRDIGAARGAGVWAYGVRTGHGCRDAARYPGGPQAVPAPDLMFDDVGEAVDFCIRYRTIAEPVLTATGQRPRNASPLIVAICGRSRSGKSVVAHAVARALIDEATPNLHVKLDDWIMPAAERPADADAEMRSRVDLLPGIVDSLRSGRAVTAPGYDAQTRGPSPGTTYDPSGCQVIILDGLFAAHPSIRDRVDLSVFVEPPSAAQAKAPLSNYIAGRAFRMTLLKISGDIERTMNGPRSTRNARMPI